MKLSSRRRLVEDGTRLTTWKRIGSQSPPQGLTAEIVVIAVVWPLTSRSGSAGLFTPASLDDLRLLDRLVETEESGDCHDSCQHLARLVGNRLGRREDLVDGLLEIGKELLSV